MFITGLIKIQKYIKIIPEIILFLVKKSKSQI